jgi:hypothetical protein
LSSASRATALSKSKVPPQQPERPLYVFDEFFGFRTHCSLIPGWADLAAGDRARNYGFRQDLRPTAHNFSDPGNNDRTMPQRFSRTTRDINLAML